MKISFDFDGTLTLPKIQKIAKTLWFENTLYIITTRGKEFYYNNSVVFDMAKRLNIPEVNIHFTSGMMKADKALELGIELHYDNDILECEYMKSKNISSVFVQPTGKLIIY